MDNDDTYTFTMFGSTFDDLPIEKQAISLLLGAHCGNCNNLSIKTQRSLIIMQCNIDDAEVQHDFYCEKYLQK